jgi:hypothetical protein
MQHTNVVVIHYSKHVKSLTTTIHPTEIVSGIERIVKKSFGSWNKIGMDMFALKVGQEMLEPCQLSRPITTVQSDQSVTGKWYELYSVNSHLVVSRLTSKRRNTYANARYSSQYDKLRDTLISSFT